jgi:hypothetical protein
MFMLLESGMYNIIDSAIPILCFLDSDNGDGSPQENNFTEFPHRNSTDIWRHFLNSAFKTAIPVGF